MPKIPRREFIMKSTAGVVAWSTLASASASAAPSTRIRHAILGMGSRAKAHVQEFRSMDDVDLVAISDVDPKHLAKIPSHVNTVADYRRILDDPSIDTVSIATPDHWHTKMAMEAMQAGKHVYVEKPCSHTVEEAQLLIKASEATGKVIQHGTQSRGSAGIIEAIQFIHSGKLGKVRAAKAINHQMRKPIGHAPDSTPPEGVNYDMWLGPAPKRPFSQNRWHYNWHWFWDYGAGDIANDGIHQIDVARWGLNVGIPKAISASGGQLWYEDDHETPDTQLVTFEYDDCHLIYEMRLWTKYKLEGHDNGVVFYGDNGILEVGRQG